MSKCTNISRQVCAICYLIIFKKRVDNPGKKVYNKAIERRKELNEMKKFNLTPIARTYTNNGQHLEQTARYFLTGRIEKADNTPCTVDGDCNGIQIKSARATICKGTDIAAHIEKDAATEYAYITAQEEMYLMTATEYKEFATAFATVTRESEKNGGQEKTRFKSESKALLAYLEKATA